MAVFEKEVYLIEFADDGEVIEMLPKVDESQKQSKIMKAYGFKIHRILDSSGKVVAVYDHNSGRTDLDHFKGMKDFVFANVAKNGRTGKLYWMLFDVAGFETIGKDPDEKVEALYVRSQREASEEEAAALEEIFPKYFEKCY